MDFTDDDDTLDCDATSAIHIENWFCSEPSTISALPTHDFYMEDNIRIGITGSFGTGKKRIAKLLSDKLELPCVSGIARTVINTGHKLNKAATLDSQLMVWLGYDWESMECDEFVSAGTFLDAYAYFTYLNGKSLQIDRYLGRMLKNMTLGNMHNNYSTLFYTPVQQVPVKDGVRSTDKRFQHEIDKIIFDTLTLYSIPFIPLVGSLTQQVGTAWKYLEDVSG